MHPFITVINRELSTYSLCALVGVLAAMLVVWHGSRRRGHDPSEGLVAFVAACAGLLIGGSLLYGITNLPLITDIAASRDAYASALDWLASIALCFGGSVFYGGLIGALAGLLVYARVRRWDALRLADGLDVFAVAVPLFHAAGRVGCFMAGCCYGIEWAGPGAVTFADAAVPFANGVARFPVQLVESAVELLLFAAVAALFSRGALRGRLVAVWALLYAPARFLLEFLRGDAYRGFLGPLSTSQWISLAVVVAAAAFLVAMSCRLRRAHARGRAR